MEQGRFSVLTAVLCGRFRVRDYLFICYLNQGCLLPLSSPFGPSISRYLLNFLLLLALGMHNFTHSTLWTPFERLSNPNTTEVELTLSLKVIVGYSNAIITCNGILCGMIYQQTYTPGPLNNASKVLVTMSLLIITWNRVQYESHFVEELRIRVQETGPLIPTLRYIIPEVVLAIVLILEGFKAGGPAGATMTIVLLAVLFLLGLRFSMRRRIAKEIEPEASGNQDRNV